MKRVVEITKVSTVKEFDSLLLSGYIPLIDLKILIAPRLRIEIQNGLFGREKGVEKSNNKFYRYVWNNKPNYCCEECLTPLGSYSSKYISHIISRGANAFMRLDPRNTNILCPLHHVQWENGDRKSMRIYRGNVEIIEILNRDYESM